MPDRQAGKLLKYIAGIPRGLALDQGPFRIPPPY
jgi:hypothetical protein